MNGGDFGVLLWKQRKRHLAACVAVILGISSSAASATVFVTNCNDAGAGSLRSAVAGAPSGETVDASGLEGVCSKITLVTGAIMAFRNDVTIKGPGAERLSVTALYSDNQYANRIITHSGTGLLYLQDITITHGYEVADPPYGGCIYSKGSVALKNAVVTWCQAKNSHAATHATGGGIFAKGSLTMKQSTLSLNFANGGSGGAYAGGAYSNGFRAYYSSVTGNVVSDAVGMKGNYGGIQSRGTGAVYIFNSTIGLNNAAHRIGGLAVQGAQADVKIVNSTISSNSATNEYTGGAYLFAQAIEISNSTISANTAKKNHPLLAAGLAVFNGTSTAPTFVMRSSIVANNLYGSPAATDSDLSSNIVVTGSNNLVQISNASVPADTIVGKCAFLGPLRDNGGLTQTQAPLGHSPAIDAGNNTFGADVDQRGKLSVNGDRNYPRVLGKPGGTPRADIGAYEINGADKIYDADFDSC